MNQAMTTPEQQARDMLEKATSSDLPVIVADIIAERDALKAELERVKVERDCWGNRWHQERRKVAELRYPGMTGVVKPQSKELAAIKGAGEPVAWALWLPGESTPRQLHLSKDASLSAAGRWPEAYQGCVHVPLYTRPSVPLTDEQITAFCNQHAKYQEEGYELSGWYDFARAIEAHIKGAKG